MPSSTDAPIAREQVLAFRARRHGLAERRPADGLLDVVASCAVQDTPPGNADVALAARLDVDGPVAAGAVEAKQLALTWSVRGAPHLVAVDDLPMFTLGAAPEPGTRATLWRQPEEALDVVEDAMVQALQAPMTKAELSSQVTAALPSELTPFCQRCGAHHPDDGVFRGALLLGRIVLTSTSPVRMVRAAEWFGAEATGDVEELQRELLLRHVRCYAPTTWGDFAAWAGITNADAKRRWQGIADDVVGVDGAYVLEEDLDELRDGSAVAGVRLLPARDAWLQARDRDRLFPDRAQRSAVYRAVGAPGAVLVDGAPAGVWRAAAKGRRLEVRWRPFDDPSTVDIEPEAQRVAAARGLDEAAVVPWD